MSETIEPLVPAPLIQQLWPLAIEAQQRSDNLGRCLAEARHRLEETCGLQTLEVPLSHLCDSRPFRLFTLHVLSQLDRFCNSYNASLSVYRKQNRVRSQAHPVPDLKRDGDWWESPFWMWSDQFPKRKPLFVRKLPGKLELSDGRHSEPLSMVLSVDKPLFDYSNLKQLSQWRQSGIKLRPRALLTTMYARLLLSDLFLHGIGGAKYDQLTDQLLIDWFDCPTPTFVTATATLHLPIQRTTTYEADDHRNVLTQLREIDFNPDRFLNNAVYDQHEANQVSSLIDQKNELLRTAATDEWDKQSHDDLSAVNKKLQRFVSKLRSQLIEKNTKMKQLKRHELVFASREYSFGLFPQSFLTDALLELSSRHE